MTPQPISANLRTSTGRVPSPARPLEPHEIPLPPSPPVTISFSDSDVENSKRMALLGSESQLSEAGGSESYAPHPSTGVVINFGSVKTDRENVEPGNEVDTPAARIDALHKLLKVCPQALSPSAPSGTSILMPNQIAGHSDHTRLRNLLKELKSGKIRRNFSGEAGEKKTVRELRNDLGRTLNEVKRCDLAVSKFGATFLARRIILQTMFRGAYLAQRDTFKFNNASLSKHLETSQIAFERACQSLIKISESLEQLNPDERTALSGDFNNCVSKVNEACTKWIKYKMVDPEQLGPSYMDLMALGSQQSAFDRPNRIAYLRDMLANRKAVETSRHEACRELWSDVNTLKGAFHLAEELGPEGALPPSSMRASLVNMLRGFEFLITSANLHVESVSDRATIPDTRARAASSHAVDKSAGQEGAHLANIVLSQDIRDAESQVRLMLPFLNKALEKVNCGIAGAILSIEQGLKSVAERAEVGRNLHDLTYETSRIARAYEEMSQWLSRTWQDEARDPDSLKALSDTQLHDMQARIAALHEFSETLAWAGETALANSRDRGVARPVIELPPDGWEDEESAPPVGYRSAEKNKKDGKRAALSAAAQDDGRSAHTGQAQNLEAGSAVPLVKAKSAKATRRTENRKPARQPAPLDPAPGQPVKPAEKKPEGELTAQPSQIPDLESFVLSDFLPKPPAILPEPEQHEEKFPISERPGFLNMKEEINDVIGMKLEDVQQARKRAQECYDRSRTTSFEFLSSDFLKEMAVELERGASTMRQAREVLREKSKPFMGNNAVLFPQLDIDLETQVVDSERIAAWMHSFSEDPRSKPLSTSNFRELCKKNLLIFSNPTDRVQEGVVFTASGLLTTETFAREKSIVLWNGRKIQGRQYVIHSHLKPIPELESENFPTDDFTRKKMKAIADTLPIDEFTIDMISSVRAKYMEHRKISFEWVDTVNENRRLVKQKRFVPDAKLSPEQGLAILKAGWEAMSRQKQEQE